MVSNEGFFNALSGDFKPEQKQIVENLQKQLVNIQSLVEKKAWPDLTALADFDTFIFNGFPEKLSDIVAELQEHTKSVSNLQFVIREITKADISSTEVQLSGKARLFWDIQQSWEEHFIDLDIALVAKRPAAATGAWRGVHLVINVLPKAAQTAAEKHAAPAGFSTAYFAEAGSAGTLGSYMADTPMFSERSSTRAGKKHLVYVPVILDHETLKGLFGSDG